MRANYTGYHALQTDDYFLYDDNNRMTLNKGQLVNNQMVITTTKGTSLAYDAAGNIKQALNYENGTLQHYDYQYNNENQLELIKKDGMSQQAKIYDAAGHVVQENLFNNKGVLTQKNIMTYEKGTLVTQSVRDQFDKETSLTVSTYDDVGNLTNSNLRVFAQGSQSEYSLNHHYTYALWDNYLQEVDEATRIMYGATYHGKSTRSYDANGLLKASVDQQADANGKTNSTQYWNSGIDGIKARSDSSGKTHYLTFNHKTLGDLRLDDLKNQHLNVFGGFTPQGSQNGAAQSTGQFLERSAAENEGIPPESTQDNLGAYTLQQGDSLESIAFQVYGDGSLWYLIADANGLSCGKNETAQGEGSLHTGQRLNLPPVATGQHHTSKTRRVFSSDYMIGMTAATTKIPLPPPPPPTPTRNHGLLSKIVVGIVATIATVLTAGVIGALAGVVATTGTGIFAIGTTVLGGGMASLAGNLAAGFAAGFMGSIASQGMARSFHMQEGISLKGALVNGLISAASTGTLSQLKGWGPQKDLMTKLAEKTPSEFNLVSATQTIESNVTSQSLGLLTRQQHNFEWDQLGTSAITAGILGGKTGQRLQDALKKLDFKTGMLASELNTAAHAFGANVTGTAQDIGDALKNNLGHAIGNGIVDVSSLNNEENDESIIEAILELDEDFDGEERKKVDKHNGGKVRSVKKNEVAINKDKIIKENSTKAIKKVSKEHKSDVSKIKHTDTALKELQYGDRFEKILSLVLGNEGGESDSPNDYGKFTNHGVSLKTLEDLKKYEPENLKKLGLTATRSCIKNITAEQVKAFYKVFFWDRAHIDEIKSFSVAYTFFDFYINTRPQTSIPAMKRAINQLGGNIKVNARLDSNTLKAINSLEPKSLFDAFNAQRKAHYKNQAKVDSMQAPNLKGWLARLRGIKFGD